jgi:quercetin dioxygenase-like cupin family protein
MRMNHVVKAADEMKFATPSEFVPFSSDYYIDAIVGEESGAVQMGFQLSRLDSGGHVAWHVHSFEETLFVVTGSLVVDLEGTSLCLKPGDYGLFPVATPHAIRNVSESAVTFAEMRAPMPRSRFDNDSYFVASLERHDASEIDVRDPRTRNFGHIDPENMDPAMQTQDRLALSASMRTALLVYSGISVKMMIDSDLGADLSTMFMVQYVPGGFAGAHDHPLEEAYLILEGQVEATFDDEKYRLGPGDVAWAGVGCVHEFRNIGEGHVRWLETQAPQPPPRHSYRFRRDWTYLENALATPRKEST